MGSLNQDGSQISQSRKTLRNVGGAHSLSADRVELEVIQEQTPESASDELGTNANLTTSQYSTVAISEMQKTTTPVSDSLIALDREIVIESPIGVNPPWTGSSISVTGGAGLPLTYDGSSIVASGYPTIAQIITSSPLLPAGDSLTIPSGGQFYLNAVNDPDVELIISESETFIHHPLRTSFDTPDASIVCSSEADPDEIGIRITSQSGIYLDGPQKLARYYTEVVTMGDSETVVLGFASGVIIVVMGSGLRTVDLPEDGVDMSLLGGETFYIKDGAGTASSGNIILNANGSTLDGAASGVLNTNYESRTVVYNGLEWNNI